MPLFGSKKKTTVSKGNLEDATELTRFAIAALNENDSEMAEQRIKEALRALGRTV